MWRPLLSSLATFPSNSTDVDIETMKRDPVLKQLVSDQDWHIWMDDRRSLLSYPVVRCRCFLMLLFTSPFPTAPYSWSRSCSFGYCRGETANMPCIASATMIFTPKKRPHFPATSRLGKPSGPRTNSFSCIPIAIPCMHPLHHFFLHTVIGMNLSRLQL